MTAIILFLRHTRSRYECPHVQQRPVWTPLKPPRDMEQPPGVAPEAEHVEDGFESHRARSPMCPRDENVPCCLPHLTTLQSKPFIPLSTRLFSWYFFQTVHPCSYK